jgi:hypothetical protein
MLRVASGDTAPGQASLRRALLLLRLGELQELLTLQDDAKGICEFIQSMLQQEADVSRWSSGGGAPGDAPMSWPFASLRVVKAENVALPVALIEGCAATLTELDCYRLGYDDSYHRILPRCARLESLCMRDWYGCPPAAWLGLSQLHTLRGVSLYDVPAAVIAAALPRLHTLHLYQASGDGEFSVAAFYDELLPRLRSFRVDGRWPAPSSGRVITDVPPLPRLEDLEWNCWLVDLPRRFRGARPSTLNTSDVSVFEWLAAAGGTPARSPLICLRTLTLRVDETPPDAAFMSVLLRMAPHLRQLTFHMHGFEDVLSILSDAFPSEPASARVVHPTLRHIAVTSTDPAMDVLVPRKCGARLRQLHFPRLRRLSVGHEEYPV